MLTHGREVVLPLRHVFLLVCAGMEGCYNGFLSYSNEEYNFYAADLCGYMYLFNNNQALLSQYASLTLNPGNGPEPLPYGALFKDLGQSSQYSYVDYTLPLGFTPYLATTLYANGACAYEHFLVSARSP